jgi:citrate lyase beta subunit
MNQATRARRSLLFAPGNRQEVHAKALASGADIVCIDLEDAVPPHAKAEARAIAMQFLSETGGGKERAVRINSPRSADGLRDMLAIIGAAPPHGTVFLPKVADAGEVRLVDDILCEAGLPLNIAVLIETVEGLENVAAILRASPRIVFAMFGAVDLSAELGVPLAHEPLLYARSRLVHAASLAGVAVLDVPSLDFRDQAAVRSEAERAKGLGFSGKAAIHPANIDVINAVFTPGEAEIAQAQKIIDACRNSPTGMAVVDGKLVEKPVVRAMERILALRGLTGE